MDLEQLEETQIVETMSVDAEQLVADIEEAGEYEVQAVSALNTVSGLLDMESTYDKIVVADNESITENQLAAFRAGVASSMIAANGNMKVAFGIDTEASFTDATTAYAKDVEGIKEFFKKIWQKIKAGLVKANAFFRKMFLKFINMVSFRKGTLEKLEEDVAAAATGNEELKASKFGIVKKLAAPATVAGKLSGDTIAMDLLIMKVMFYGADGTPLETISKATSEAAKSLKALLDAKTLDNAALENVGAKLMSTVTTVMEDKDAIKSLEKVDASSMKKFKKANAVAVLRATGSNIYMFGVSEKASIITGSVKVKADKVKKATGLTGSFVTAALKVATKANDEFKDIVNTAFDAYDTAEDIASAFEGVKLESLDEDVKKGVKAMEKMGKNLVSNTPWIAFHTSMGVYKSTGYVIGLAKAYLKDVKDDDKK